MRAKDKRGLTAMQEKFCRERVIEDKNQTQAYKDAGYGKGMTDKTAKEAASRLSKLEYIQKRIAELQEQVEAGAILNAKQIQAEVANIAMDPESSKNIKLKAFDQLSRMQGAYTDNSNINATVTVGPLPSNMHVMFSKWDGMPMDNPHGLPVFACKLKAGNADAVPFESMHRCPGNCDVCKAAGRGCVVGESSYADEH